MTESILNLYQTYAKTSLFEKERLEIQYTFAGQKARGITKSDHFCSSIDRNLLKGGSKDLLQQKISRFWTERLLLFSSPLILESDNLIIRNSICSLTLPHKSI